MSHIMVDLETLGRKPGCVILSIGAVSFDPFDPNAEQFTFERVIDITSSLFAGFNIEQETLEWWRKQSEEAKAPFFSRATHRIKNALIDFQEWCKHRKADRIWAQGVSFDPPILEEAFKICGLQPSWKYNAPRDTRTVYDLFDLDMTKMQREGNHHNALDDARFQVKCIHAAIQKGKDAEWLSKIKDMMK